MDEEKDRLLKRIKKLFAIANSASDAESDSAMAQAQKLMAEHHIRSSEVKALEEDRDVNIKSSGIDYSNFAWQLRLALVIAENFRCRVYHTRASKRFHSCRKVSFLGEGEDSDIALSVFSFAIETGRIRALEHVGERRLLSRLRIDDYTLGTIKYTFLDGFVKGVGEMFSKQKEKNQQWGLVLVVPKTVEDAFDRLELAKSRPINDRSSNKFAGDRQCGFAEGLKFRPDSRVLA